MMKIVITLIVLTTLISKISADGCFCDGVRCGPGQICSNELRHCVCQNTLVYTNYATLNLPVTIFDFKADGVWFNNGNPNNIYVDNALGNDDNPVFLSDTQALNTFHNFVDGTNIQLEKTLTINRVGQIYRLEGLDYFPIDGEGFGNEGLEHNYLFTTKAVWAIDYNGGEYINVRYDDGILIYVNRKLVINYPNLHYNASTTVYLDDVAAEIGIAPGFTYPLHIFHTERHIWMSILDLTTNAVIHPPTCSGGCNNDRQCGTNGLCDSVQRNCKCRQGWSGTFCNISVCQNVDCGQGNDGINSGRGSCDPKSGKCQCNKHWAGDKCNIKSCNYRGEHQNDGTCKCDNYYNGKNCDRCTNSTTYTDHRGNLQTSYYLCQRYNNGWRLGQFSESEYNNLIHQRTSNYCHQGTNDLDCSCAPYSFSWGQIDFYGSDDDDDDGQVRNTTCIGDGCCVGTNNCDGNNNGHQKMMRSIRTDATAVSDSDYYQRRIDLLKGIIETAAANNGSILVAGLGMAALMLIVLIV